MFARNSWGGTFHDDFQPQPGDVLAAEHRGSSGFANTDLHLQLKQHGIRPVIMVGMIANTCIEATGRFGIEFGYHVTLVKDATAAFIPEAMRAAHAMSRHQDQTASPSATAPLVRRRTASIASCAQRS